MQYEKELRTPLIELCYGVENHKYTVCLEHVIDSDQNLM